MPNIKAGETCIIKSSFLSISLTNDVLSFRIIANTIIRARKPQEQNLPTKIRDFSLGVSLKIFA